MKNYADNIPEYSVDEVANAVKNIVEDHFPYIKIRGEISGLKIHSSGHIYFNLKDENAVISAVCFKNMAANLRMMPEEGMEIVATGKITTYKQRSNYQILVSSIEAAGAGALMALFEKRKKEFEEKGYFKQEHKKQICRIPKRIAVITSETGAVFHDICHRIEQRHPCHIILCPVAVQGKGAELEIANAIREINEITDKSLIPDTIIVARGGGSIEDLWCFNEEVVIRAVYDSNIPVISAIGHEPDITLIDYCADLRAPTPTAAAELSTPDRAEVLLRISNLGERNNQKILELTRSLSDKISYLGKGVKHPEEIINYYMQRIDDLNMRREGTFSNYMRLLEARLENLGKLVSKNHLVMRFEKLNSDMEGSFRALSSSFNSLLNNKSHKLDSLAKLIDSLSYKNVIKRGYAVLRGADGKVISKVSGVGDNEVMAELADGTVKMKKG